MNWYRYRAILFVATLGGATLGAACRVGGIPVGWVIVGCIAWALAVCRWGGLLIRGRR